MSTSKPLPDDILRDILSRLPVKSLLRLQSVCKSWLSLLSDPYFITFHHNRTAADPQNHIIIIRTAREISFLNRTGSEKLTNIVPLPDLLVGNIVRVCNGLVSLRSSGGKATFLWNPSTRKYKKIENPTGNTKLQRGKISFSFGFGLDVDGYSFICLRLVCARWGMAELTAEVQMYSTLTDSWKTLKGGFNALEYTNCAIVKGVSLLDSHCEKRG